MKQTRILNWWRVAPLVILFVMALPWMAAGAGYLKIEGVDGESTDKDHKDWIDILSYGFSVSLETSSTTGGGAGAGKVNVSEIVISKEVDASSPKLMEYCIAGRNIRQVLLNVYFHEQRERYLEVKLSDVLITSYSTGGGTADGSIPTDQISLNYSEIEYTYTSRDEDAGTTRSVSTGYDVLHNVIQTAADPIVMQLP